MNVLARLRGTNDENRRPDFAGKIVAVYTNSEERGGGVFEDVKLVRLGFCDFLVGRRVSRELSEQERWSKVTIWIAVTDIAQMMVFEDVESARLAFQTDVSNPTAHGSDEA
jgi:hypothetical protein